MAIQTPREQTTVAFELARFGLEDDRLTVTGRWSGVRGRRFMRPAISVLHDPSRRALAELEQKPWAADAEEPWVATFPWTDAAGGDFELAVAPDVAVRLPKPRRGPGGRRIPIRLVAFRPGEAPPDPEPAPVPAAVEEPEEPAPPDPARLAAERDAALAELRRTEHERDAAIAARKRAVSDREAADEERRRAEQARDTAVRERWRAEEERDTTAGELRQAIRERDTALKASADAGVERDRAVTDSARAETARLAVEAELTAIRAEHDRLRKDRDTAIAAQRRAIAELDAALTAPPPPPPAAALGAPVEPPAVLADETAPIFTMPEERRRPLEASFGLDSPMFARVATIAALLLVALLLLIIILGS